MEQHILGWAKPLLMLSASDEFSCRQLAVTALNANLEVLVKNRKDIISGCAVVLKQVSNLPEFFPVATCGCDVCFSVNWLFERGRMNVHNPERKVYSLVLPGMSLRSCAGVYLWQHVCDINCFFFGHRPKSF